MNWKAIAKYILVFVIGLTIGLSLRKESVKTVPIQEIVKDSIIRDSIYIINDSIRTKIIYINKKYDEKVNTIISASDSANLHLFTGYIEDYKRATQNN